METIKCSTQEELDAALLVKDADIELHGSGEFVVSGSSQVRAYDSSQVTATKQVPVTVHGSKVKAEGGVQIAYTPPSTAQEWCENYGVEIKDGVAILFKGVNDDFASPIKTSYAPGTMPEAPDWDGGKEECGGGLHFSPWPSMTYKYHPEAKRFVACPVRVEDIAVHVDASYPDKVKAPRVCAPCWEVDINGNRK